MFTKFKGKNRVQFKFPFVKKICDSDHVTLNVFGLNLSKKKRDESLKISSKNSVVQKLQSQFSLLSAFRNHFIERAKPDCYNLILHRHIGDSYVILNLIQNLNARVHIFIQDKHACLMELFPNQSYDTYSLKDFSELNFELQVSDDQKFLLDFILRDIFEKTFPSFPIKGVPFIISPIEFLRLSSPYENFVNGWGKMLGINEQKITPKSKKLPIKLLPEQYRSMDLSNVVLLCPDSHSQKTIPESFWDQLTELFKKRGLNVIINSLHRKEINGIKVSKLALRDAIIIGQNCKCVVSTRSGIADILLASQKKTVIINPFGTDYNYLSANNNFNILNYPCEILLEKKISHWDIRKAISEIDQELFII